MYPILIQFTKSNSMKMKMKLKTYKKSIRTLIILIPLSLTTLKSISQTSDSVTCLPNSQLRNAIKKIEYCKLIERELDLTKIGITLLKERIKIKDSIIRNYDLKDDEYEKKIKNYELSVSNLNLQLANQKTITNIYRTINKKNKYLYGFGGLVVGVIVTLIAK